MGEKRMSEANDGTGNCVERDEWETPKKLWDTLNEQYNFTFDCCASKKNTKCLKCFTKDTSFLNVIYPISENNIAWLNPPFSKARKIFEHFFKIIDQGIAIYRCDNIETRIWQDIIFQNASWVFIPNKRIRYEGMPGKGSRFPSALIGLNVPYPTNLKGTILEVKRCV